MGNSTLTQCIIKERPQNKAKLTNLPLTYLYIPSKQHNKGTYYYFYYYIYTHFATETLQSSKWPPVVHIKQLIYSAIILLPLVLLTLMQLKFLVTLLMSASSIAVSDLYYILSVLQLKYINIHMYIPFEIRKY